MGECSEFRGWEELIPDALGLIFRNLSLQEILTVIPRVCKSWGQTVSGPYCWQVIDIEEWSQRCKPEQLDRMLRMLIARSCGSFRRLSVYGLSNDSIFSLIADHSGSLQSLELPRSEISYCIVEQVSGRFQNITFLDLSYCKHVGARALEAFGRHCNSLTRLRRIMRPFEVVDKECQDDEAIAISWTMTKLRRLEMAYLLLTTIGVLNILSGCKSLEFLDIRGCWEVKLEEKFIKEKHPALEVLGPHIVDYYDSSFWSDCSYYSDSSDYSWEFMEDDIGVYEEASDDDIVAEDVHGLPVRFYGIGFSESNSWYEL